MEYDTSVAGAGGELHDVAVDTGGTFTDVAVRRASGDVLVWKVPSQPARPNDAVVHGLTDALGILGATPAQVARFSHGTTVATNTVLTRTGARVGLVTTEGFRDVLRIGHQARPSVYDQAVRRPDPIVSRSRTWEVAERVDADGEVLEEPAADAVTALGARIRDAGCDVVVVSFLNAYANPAHEHRCVDLLTAAGAAPQVVAATSVTPEMREYERTSTAALNAYVSPAISSYLGRLEGDLGDVGVASRLWIMQSNGGLIGTRVASEQSVRTILSGLAGGVRGAAAWASHLGLARAVSIDIGGTSTDIALIRDGVPDTMTEGRIEGYDMRLPVVDVHTIGAGGGSVAWLDSGGGLRVGPQSAGADPGPVCYDRGGDAITVTDAHLLLGRLGTSLLDGRMTLDATAARKVLDELAGDLGITPDEAAAGIVRITGATMARGIRRVSVERGVDVRECTLIAFGGAGPLHAGDLLRELGMAAAVVPPHPGIASAVGMLDAPLKHDFAANLASARRGDADPRRVDDAVAELVRRATAFLRDEEHVGPDAVTMEHAVDVRYIGQSYELTVPWDGGHDLRARFDAAHEERYGYADREAEIELVTARVTASAPVTTSTRLATLEPGPAPDPVAHRPFLGADGWGSASVFRRADVPADAVLRGPLIVEQLDSTVVVLAGQSCRHDRSGFLHISASESA